MNEPINATGSSPSSAKVDMAAGMGIPYPDKAIFENDFTEVTQVTSEVGASKMFFIDHIEYPEEKDGGGIYIYKFGADVVQKDDGVYLENIVPLHYPTKGFPTPEAVGANNIAKRALINQVVFFMGKQCLPFLAVFALMPYRYKLRVIEQWLKSYFMLAKMVLNPYFMLPYRYTHFSRELRKATHLFLVSIGIGDYYASCFSQVFAHILEYDDAYRVRVEDILSETDSLRLQKSPRAEIERLLNILNRREGNPNTQNKFSKFSKVLSYLLVLPKIKRAFVKTVQNIDFTKLQFDDADRYHVSALAGYEFFGIPFDIRATQYALAHANNPPSRVLIPNFDSGSKPKGV